MMKLVDRYNSILRHITQNFDFENPPVDPKKLEQELIDIMLKNGGIGLSANQVGLPYRVFAMGYSGMSENAIAFFNPVIVSAENSQEFLEGCLSFPGIFVKVSRPKKIFAQWQNSSGEYQEGEFEGLNAHCFCHEYDHLMGITMQDKISPLKWSRAVQKSMKIKGKK